MHGGNLIFIIVLVVVFYFLLILPQRRQQKKKAEMRKQLMPGSRVMTASGIYGDIIDVSDDVIVVRVADGVDLEMDPRAVVRVVSEAPAEIEADEDDVVENEEGHILGAPDQYEHEDHETDEDDVDAEADVHHSDENSHEKSNHSH